MLSPKEDLNEDGNINKNGRLYNVQGGDDDENETSNSGRTSNTAPFEHQAVYLLLSLCYLRWSI